MSSENSSEPSAPNFLSEEELRAELEDAEQRKEEDLRKNSRIASLILCVPVLLLLGAAGIFLLQYETPAPMAEKKNTPSPAPDPAASAAPVPRKTIDKSDLEFATRLLNFGNAADGPPEKH